tara:strand:+ start:63 stop:281 length:219 start_codon:yes stop_codon:yes gene_type:complete
MYKRAKKYITNQGCGMINITKEKFLDYDRVKKQGKFDMNSDQARRMTTLSIREWNKITKEYVKLSKAWSKNS